MTDDDVITGFVQQVPGAIKNRMVTKLADELRPVIREAIMFERERCANVAAAVRKDAQNMVKQAQATRDQRMLIAADASARCAHGVMGLIRIPPGACTTCLGRREVASTLAPGMMVRCPDCPPLKEAAPPSGS